MKGLIRHLLDNAADHDALIKILWDTLDLCVVTTAEHRLLDAPPKERAARTRRTAGPVTASREGTWTRSGPSTMVRSPGFSGSNGPLPVPPGSSFRRIMAFSGRRP